METLNRSGVNISDIKENNRSLIFKHICTNDGISRIDLARKTGLTKMTISNIINDLIKVGIVSEVTEEYYANRQIVSNAVGRKPKMLTIAGTSPVAVGLLVSRDCCKGVLTDLKARVIREYEIALERNENSDTLMAKIIKCAKHLCKGEVRKVIGIGISALGPVDIRKGMLLKPTNFYGISNLNICEEVSGAVGGIPTYITEDMDASALAERYFGICKNVSNFIYIGITNGIGSGIISGGELFHGGSGFGGEFGHTSINYKGELCHCKNRGCIELYASSPNIITNYNKTFNKNVNDLEEIVLLSETDKATAEYLDDICEKLAIALTSTVNILDPTIIVIGHDGYYFNDRMLKFIENRLNECILVSGYKKISVLRSSFKDGASMIGAATTVMDKIFNNQLNIFE